MQIIVVSIFWGHWAISYSFGILVRHSKSFLSPINCSGLNLIGFENIIITAVVCTWYFDLDRCPAY